MKSSLDHKIKIRMIVVSLGFFLLMAVIGAKAVYLQVFCGEWLSQKAANQYEKSQVTFGKRGTIYDTSQQAMAVTIETASVAAYPARIKNHIGNGQSVGCRLEAQASLCGPQAVLLQVLCMDQTPGDPQRGCRRFPSKTRRDRFHTGPQSLLPPKDNGRPTHRFCRDRRSWV